MTNSKNHKFIDIYKEFEDGIILKSNKNKESTLDLKYAISGHITDYFDKYNIEEITYDTVEGYKSFRKSQIFDKPKNKGKNINSISLRQLERELIILRKFFNFCLKRDLIDINPVRTKNSFKKNKPGRHSIDLFDTKFKIKKDVFELFNIAIKKYEEKRNKAFPTADYINNRLRFLLKNKQFLNSNLIKYKESTEQIKIKIYNFIIADIDAYNLDRNKMLEWIVEEEVELMDKAYNEGIEKLNLLIEAKSKQVLAFKKIIRIITKILSRLNTFERALIILKFIRSGIFNFKGLINEAIFNKRQEIFYYNSGNMEHRDSIQKQIQRKKALKLQLFSYKTFYLDKNIYNKYLALLETIKKTNSRNKQDYSFGDLINFKLFELLSSNPMILKKDRFEYDDLLYPYEYLRINLTKSNKDLMTELQKKDKFKNIDWHKAMQAIIEYTIILIGEEIDDLDLKKYMPQDIN
ncbi:MAG: hypothetical protein M0012_07090 [Deltaproteobacteria bacterium]|nr:hypothetical protein [Deltaproteobacteria bacterium]